MVTQAISAEEAFNLLLDATHHFRWRHMDERDKRYFAANPDVEWYARPYEPVLANLTPKEREALARRTEQYPDGILIAFVGRRCGHQAWYIMHFFLGKRYLTERRIYDGCPLLPEGVEVLFDPTDYTR
jgi:hypothetical protein